MRKVLIIPKGTKPGSEIFNRHLIKDARKNRFDRSAATVGMNARVSALDMVVQVQA